MVLDNFRESVLSRLKIYTTILSSCYVGVIHQFQENSKRNTRVYILYTKPFYY